MNAEGNLIAGRYRVQSRIGSGAMGVVWEAYDEVLHRVVAIKQLLIQAGLDSVEAGEARERAMREGRIAARLHHPNAITVFDVIESNGQPCLVMEYLPSRSLSAVMAEVGPLPPREVARIGAEVAKALTAAHDAGIVHRDIKPGNILLGDNGTVKITDFGISRAKGDVTVTKTGMLAGTPAYLSPDVAIGREPSPASDVFSLGSTLYAAVEGQPPFGLDENTLALLHSVAAGAVYPPRYAGPLTATLMWMLRADTEARPDMPQAAAMLRAISDGHDGPSMPSMPMMAPVAASAATQFVGHDAQTRAMRSSPNMFAPMPEGADDPTMMAAQGTTVTNRPVTESKRKPLLIIGLLGVLLVVGVILASTMFDSPGKKPGPSPVNDQPTGTSLPSPTIDTPTTEQVVPGPVHRSGHSTAASESSAPPVTPTTDAVAPTTPTITSAPTPTPTVRPSVSTPRPPTSTGGGTTAAVGGNGGTPPTSQ